MGLTLHKKSEQFQCCDAIQEYMYMTFIHNQEKREKKRIKHKIGFCGAVSMLLFTTQIK